MFLGKLDADSQRVHLSRLMKLYDRAEMKGLFTLGSRCANRSHRQYFFLNSVMTLLGSSSCSYSSASNISSVPLMKKKFSHPLMENSMEQPSGSNRTMNGKKYRRVESAAAIGSARCASVREVIATVYFALNFEEQLDHEILYRFYTFAKSDTIYAKKIQLQESSRIATNQLRSLIINACMHALNVQLKALRIGGIQLRKEAY
ncbi:hypothetical protein T01_917 [Trichinella spiralis]|uniref:Uncharacterized protein n=1 Tax=Trichinella spiralis TaxID=6334 RepID=A0A0V1B271_TRISP|nr:hypothetical protein T01_917 [Trichinella spiralis]